MFGSDFSGEYRLTRQVYTCLRLLPVIFAAVYGYGKSSLSKPLNLRISVFTSAVTACCDVIFVCIPAPDHILFQDQHANGWWEGARVCYQLTRREKLHPLEMRSWMLCRLMPGTR